MTLGVASSIQVFYLPGEEPLPIWSFISFGGDIDRKVHCLLTLGSYNLRYTCLWSLLVGQKTGAAEMGILLLPCE